MKGCSDNVKVGVTMRRCGRHLVNTLLEKGVTELEKSQAKTEQYSRGNL